MKTFLLISALLAVAFARPAEMEEEEPIPIVRQVNENNFDGNNFETGNGIIFAEEGHLKDIENSEGETSQGQEVVGAYSYTAPDGSEVKVTYTANENGFQPTGDVLPVAPELPPLPEAIARAVKYIEEHPPKEHTVYQLLS